MSKQFPGKATIVNMHNHGGKKTKFMIRLLNRLINWTYRMRILPIFGFGFMFMVIEHQGRKTGKRRFNPVLHYKFHTGKTTIYSARGRRAQWVKNIEATGEMSAYVYKGFRRRKMKLRIIEDEEERYQHLVYFCKNYWTANQIFGFNRRKDMEYIGTEAFRNILNYVEFIQFEPINE